jgi:hypothetical protein
MPQLPFERTPILLLGSYLNNLTNQIQRLLPFMTRTGDLMQRESLIKESADRVATAEMANQVGDALEMVSKATGAIAHLYKT